MDYYIISQDERITDFAEPTGLLKLIDKDELRRNGSINLTEDPVQVYIKEKSENEYIDFIERPVPLISDKLKQLFDNYQKDMAYRPVVLADVKHMKQDLYWLIVPKRIDCLSEKSEFNIDETLKRLVIDEGKVGKNRIFSIYGIIESLILINLDVVESILRRDFCGIRFKKIERDQLAEGE